MTAEPASAMFRLDQLAAELDRRSNELADTQRQLEPIAQQYDDFLADFEVGLWEAHVKDNAKLPPEPIRLHLAHKAMPATFLGSYRSLTAKRDRLQKRISTVKTEVEAQRSILSALKVEAEASGAGMRAAA